MSTLHNTVRRAQRRLWLNRWLEIVGWCLAGAGGLFLLAVVIQRMFLPTHAWLGLTAAALAGAALLTSLIWLAASRDTSTAAAARLDQAAGLKERISSGLYCEKSPDPFAQAVVTDAHNLAAKITVSSHLPVRVPSSATYAGGTLVLALLIFWLFPVLDLTGRQKVQAEQQNRAARSQQARAVMKPVVEQEIKKLTDKNPTLKNDLDQLDPFKDAKINAPADVRQEMVKQVQQLADKKEAQRNNEQMARADEFRRMMRQLSQQQKSDSPVGALSKALSQGDYKAAQDALNQIQKDLATAPKTPEDQKRSDEVKQQLQDLAKKIDQLSTENKKMVDELAKSGLKPEEVKRALEQLQKKDLNALAKELEKKGLNKQQIDKLMQQAKKSCEAGKMASNLGQNLKKAAQGSSSTGQLSQSAEQGLSAAGQQLSDLESMQQELNQLNSQLADLNNLKDNLGKNCSECNGTGMKDGKPCSRCNGSGMGGTGNQGGAGSGMGAQGVGEGGRAPMEATDFRTVQKKSPVNTLPGSIISQQWVNGETPKGEATKEYVQAAIAAKRKASDAIAKEQIPRSLQRPVSNFFDRSTADLPAGSENAPPPTTAPSQ